MSHLIMEHDTVYTPEASEFEKTWHELQTPVQGGIQRDGSNTPNVFIPIVESGFRLTLDGKLISTVTEDSESNPLDGWKMILADHEKGLIPLHVAKQGYTIHQNRTLFDSIIKSAIAVCGADNVTIATVGTLGNCAQFFVSIAIKGICEFSLKRGNGLNDKHSLFFNLISSHNAILASQIMLSVIRMVCMNTVMMSVNESEQTGRQSKFKHTASSLEAITPQKFEASLKEWLSGVERHKATLEAIAAYPLNVDGFRAFASGIFTNDGSDELSTHSFNRIEAMTPLFQSGKGNRGESLLDAYNAVTEYFNPLNDSFSKGGNKAKRVAMANFGRGNDWKRLALDIAGNEELLADTLKRGTILYSDKVKVMAGAN